MLTESNVGVCIFYWGHVFLLPSIGSADTSYYSNQQSIAVYFQNKIEFHSMCFQARIKKCETLSWIFIASGDQCPINRTPTRDTVWGSWWFSCFQNLECSLAISVAQEYSDVNNSVCSDYYWKYSILMIIINWNIIPSKNGIVE